MFLLDFNPKGFIDSLQYMGIGMAGIFAVMTIIIGSVYLISYLSNKISKKNK